MFLRTAKIVSIILFVFLVSFTLDYTSKAYNNILCSDINVQFPEDELINLDVEKIKKIVLNSDNELTHKTIGEINTNQIEEEIEKHPAILNAEVFTVGIKDSLKLKGMLSVKIKHRRPIVRIMSSYGNYYLDKEGAKIPISTDYTANVLVASGYFDEDFATKKLINLINYIEDDEFWKAQIEQISIDQQKNIELTPLIGDHFIKLGTIENYESKLRNMKAFYQQIMVENNWNKYQYISLEYKNQVIAKKR